MQILYINSVIYMRQTDGLPLLISNVEFLFNVVCVCKDY